MSDELTLREARIKKLNRMREMGFDPFKVESYSTPISIQDLLDGFEVDREVSVAGRVVSYRLMGKAGFAHLSDGDSKIQAYFRKDELGEELWELYNLLDIGDHIGIEGKLFITKTGEKSIHVTTFLPLSKSLQTIPLGKEKDGQVFSGLSDVEQRYRHRHLDLITNSKARRDLIARSKMVAAVRHFFEGLGYLEVETPMLQLVAGGAAARPFLTHYNAYETDVKMRISLELYLKRLICGDLPRVFEIGRVFRNEGVSNRHSPEFTMLEFYEAFADLEVMMSRVEGCFKTVATEVFGATEVAFSDGMTIDFGTQWKRVDLLTEIERHTGLTHADLASIDHAKAALGSREVVNPVNGKRLAMEDESNLGGLIEKLLEVFVEPTLQEPTFVIGYPVETSPLAKRDPNNPRFTRRFEGYIRGKEICNAFSELNDPIDQRGRFEDQMAEREKGDDEAHPMDEEFLYAVECGMPPTGGCGIGIDRLVMMLTGVEHIREIILFPFMKPPKESTDEGREA